MSFPDPRPPFMPPPPRPYGVGGDAVGCWSQFLTNNEDQYAHLEQHGHPYKRNKTSEESPSLCLFYPSMNAMNGDAVSFWSQYPVNNEDQHPQFDQQSPHYKKLRISEEGQSNSLPVNTGSAQPIPSNAPVNKGANNIFFKTRLCAKFKVGTCRNGENCNFAHGIEDMRQPPPNWQELVGIREEDRTSSGNWDDDNRIIHKMKLCKKFYNGEECPYGERCNFLHEDPAKFRDDSGRFRESSVISIGTTGPPALNGGSNLPEDNRPANTGADVFRVSMKPVYWKTKLCNKWETTGLCPFGDKCHFAHGLAGRQLCSV